MDNWKQIEKDFIDWDNATHSNASQRQILDWFKNRIEEQESITDTDIKIKERDNERIRDNYWDSQYNNSSIK